ncbi:L-glutamine synthetase [Isosphaera pallida ATCC 43644]|jgi:glutamine synthetase|uniref:L-glutamine synthetase n=1 Tax=Isosphaera pallida (strain ATCC 43644 / DSM 9630 / IS1B) TaxID=575540 RepID=E8R5B7_ISOPI|nr:type I glutamate--ammonia ligase [Isosphaera pallida]ADV60658.1 L-glutamine synthetase [Isosphaera pallida ATCC 43644]
MTPREVLALIRSKEAQTVDLRFMDFPGVWQHFAIPADRLTEETFEEGIGFDGSSVAGWRQINEADLLVVPQPETALIDPFAARPTLMMICNIQDPLTKQDYTRDPRNIARKALGHLRSTGVADQARIATEIEFFIFDDVRFDQHGHQAFHLVDSIEGDWNTGRDERPNLGSKPRSPLGYFPCPPTDTLADLRAEMVGILAECGVRVTAHFHEAATGGQCEIDLDWADLVQAADQVMLARYVIRSVARRHGKTATFMPKPLFGDNGSGLHTHLAMRKEGESILPGHGYAGLSDTALYMIGGILKHANALCAFANPTTNSYKRLVPGFEAPTRIGYSRRNREAIVRVPIHSFSPHAQSIEYRAPDAAANPYLLFSALVMAALDGVQTKSAPGEPYDRDLYDLDPQINDRQPTLPLTLKDSLEALQRDQEFLLRGDVFTPDVLDTWIWYKRTHESEAVRVRPHPYEFVLYYDV